MRKFLITSPKFTGAAEIFFNETGMLCKIDCTNTNMDEQLMHHFKHFCPANVRMLINDNPFSQQTTVVEADFEVTFQMFWDTYKNKVNRIRAENLWKKISKTEQVEAYYGISKYDKFLQKNEWRTKADPDTYLRNKYWQNEYK
jgi:hypothetical protein